LAIQPLAFSGSGALIEAITGTLEFALSPLQVIGYETPPPPPPSTRFVYVAYDSRVAPWVAEYRTASMFAESRRQEFMLGENRLQEAA
jgi:hypothetical protein